jgi:hypothetical protein
MMNVEAQTAADSLLEHLRLSDADASVFLDTATAPPTLRVFVFNKSLFESRRFTTREWRGFAVETICSSRFRPLTGR